MWRWHRDSMQTSTRTVSRARGRDLPCSALRSVGTMSCSSLGKDGAEAGWGGGLQAQCPRQAL